MRQPPPGSTRPRARPASRTARGGRQRVRQQHPADERQAGFAISGLRPKQARPHVPEHERREPVVPAEREQQLASAAASDEQRRRRTAARRRATSTLGNELRAAGSPTASGSTPALENSSAPQGRSCAKWTKSTTPKTTRNEAVLPAGPAVRSRDRATSEPQRQVAERVGAARLVARTRTALDHVRGRRRARASSGPRRTARGAATASNSGRVRGSAASTGP